MSRNARSGLRAGPRGAAVRRCPRLPGPVSPDRCDRRARGVASGWRVETAAALTQPVRSGACSICLWSSTSTLSMLQFFRWLSLLAPSRWLSLRRGHTRPMIRTNEHVVRTDSSVPRRLSIRCRSTARPRGAYGRIAAAAVAVGRRARGARAVDLLIAAALSENLPLYTRNGDDFRALEGLIDVIVV